VLKFYLSYFAYAISKFYCGIFWIKSPLRPTLAIVPGSGFHHALKSPLQRGHC
jgi:hypothetical protein